MIPGHQVVGRVEALGPGATTLQVGDRVGVAWIASACGVCTFCTRGEENLCHDFLATGRDVNGGYAERMTVSEGFAHRIPDALTDVEAAPLLCAGAIGYRSLRLAGFGAGDESRARLALTGFGASAHLVLKLVRHAWPETRVFVFARSESERAFARELGACWAGATDDHPPEPLDAVIDTTPAWSPVVSALANLERGGRLVVNAIRKEDADKDALLGLDYPAHLWLEKEVKSVANVTRADVREFLRLAAEVPIRPEVEQYPLADANHALVALKARSVRGAKVLRVG
jgi:propanol-preferring alcohol dehydrogenase